MTSQQHAGMPRAKNPGVQDSFFNQFVYEMINQIIEKHRERPREKQDQTELCAEVETIGAQLGNRITTHLANDIQVSKKYPVQIDKTRFLCLDVWQFIFNHKVTQLKSNGMGSC